MKCKLCEERKPRRYCPGAGGDICSICCGSEREVTVNCPLDCQYLVEAHLHEKPAPLPTELPNRDIPVSDGFLREHTALVVYLSTKLVDAALETSAAVDTDVRDALSSMIRTYRTLQSGLYYESRPDNLIAAGIFEKLQGAVAALKKELSEAGEPSVRDAELLGTFAFLERLYLVYNNGRLRGRAFIGALSRRFAQLAEGAPAAPSLIQI